METDNDCDYRYYHIEVRVENYRYIGTIPEINYSSPRSRTLGEVLDNAKEAIARHLKEEGNEGGVVTIYVKDCRDMMGLFQCYETTIHYPGSDAYQCLDVNTILLSLRELMYIGDRKMNIIYPIPDKTDPKEFYVEVEVDEDGTYVGKVPELTSCYSEGNTLDELLSNIKGVIALNLEGAGESAEGVIIHIKHVKDLRSMPELVSDYMGKHHLHFENKQTISHIVAALGYRDINHFLMDNDGAVSAIIDWITSDPCEEWISKLKQLA